MGRTGPKAGEGSGLAAHHDDSRGLLSPDAPAAAARDLAADFARFGELLHAVREGRDEVLPEFTRLAETIAEHHDRADVAAVARYYSNLSAEDRRRGLDDYRSFAELWERLLESDREGLRGEAWRGEREVLFRELAAFAAEVETRPDFVPAARALSLRARLGTDLLVQLEASLDYVAREDLFEETERDVTTALELFREAGQLRPQLEPLWTRGRLARLHLDSTEARRQFEACLHVARTVGDIAFEEHALQGLVALARDAGDLHEVDRGLRELARLRPPSENWSVTWRHAERLIHEDQAQRALEFLDRHPARTERDRRVWHQLRANAFTRLGRFDEALEEIGASGNDPLRLARVALERGDAQRAFATLEDAPESPDLERELDRLALEGEALLALGRTAEAIEHLRRAVELADSFESRIRSDRATREGSNVYGEFFGLHAVTLLAEALCEDGAPLEACRVIEAAHLRLLRGEPDAALDVAAWASRFEGGLVTWSVSADRTLRIHVPADGSPPTHAVIPRGRLALQRAVRRLREAICDGREQPAFELGREIAEALLPRVPGLRGELLLLLHGPLEGLPIEWLIESGFALEGTTPIVLPGLRSAHPPASTNTGDSSWVLCGNPTDRGRPLLEGARAELAELARLRPRARSLGAAELTPQRLLETLRPGDRLHVATHLTGSDERRLGGVALRFSDGRTWSAWDIARQCPPLDLVVLAACATADGDLVDSQGLHGASRAFLQAGARNLVVTLWPVEDEAARAFSRALHEDLLMGASVAAAVASARAALRGEGAPAADWAAYRVVGTN